MSLPRAEVVPGTFDELARFQEMIRSLSAEDWQTPTRCEGWAVADVCAHVTGTWADIAAGRLDELVAGGAPERQVAERAGRSPEEVADELHQVAKVNADLAATFDDTAWSGPAPPGVQGSLGSAVEGLWYDVYVHTEDIRAALGRPEQRGPGLRASVSHLAELLTQREWGPASVALNGLEEFAVNGGGGRKVTGDPLQFVLVATGRADPGSLSLDPSVNVYG